MVFKAACIALDNAKHMCYTEPISGQTVAPKGVDRLPADTTEYGEPDRFRSIAGIESGDFYAHAGGGKER